MPTPSETAGFGQVVRRTDIVYFTSMLGVVPSGRAFCVEGRVWPFFMAMPHILAPGSAGGGMPVMVIPRNDHHRFAPPAEPGASGVGRCHKKWAHPGGTGA